MLASGQPVEAMAAANVSGAYLVSVKGSHSGKGNIAVGDTTVTINIEVKNSAGTPGQLIASNVKLVKGRFTGNGTVMGVPMTISGRIDPADKQGPLRAFTIQATFCTGTGDGGRIVGTRKGGG